MTMHDTFDNGPLFSGGIDDEGDIEGHDKYDKFKGNNDTFQFRHVSAVAVAILS